jgi:hypothetical protein
VPPAGSVNNSPEAAHIQMIFKSVFLLTPAWVFNKLWLIRSAIIQNIEKWHFPWSAEGFSCFGGGFFNCMKMRNMQPKNPPPKHENLPPVEENDINRIYTILRFEGAPVCQKHSPEFRQSSI